MPSHPIGARFSHTYISHPEQLADSERMRRRLFLLFQNLVSGRDLKKTMVSELGVALPIGAEGYDFYWTGLATNLELRDVLDTVTIVFRIISEGNGYIGGDKTRASQFIASVQRIFSEESVRYKVDDMGGVHLSVDVAFEQSRISTIQSLSGQRYTATQDLLEKAYHSLDQVPPDGKQAIRNIFFANEALFRLIFAKAHQLGSGEINKYLKPEADIRFQDQTPARQVVHKQIKQFSAWVEAAHFYRHEPASEEPVQPPLDIAIQAVATGTNWLRWLRTFDAPPA